MACNMILVLSFTEYQTSHPFRTTYNRSKRLQIERMKFYLKVKIK